MSTEIVGRFAPSPSGRMHLGNAFSCLLAWLSSRSVGGRMILRHEDLDPGRCRREYADQIEDDLRWLGLGAKRPVLLVDIILFSLISGYPVSSALYFLFLFP